MATAGLESLAVPRATHGVVLWSTRAASAPAPATLGCRAAALMPYFWGLRMAGRPAKVSAAERRLSTVVPRPRAVVCEAHNTAVNGMGSFKSPFDGDKFKHLKLCKLDEACLYNYIHQRVVSFLPWSIWHNQNQAYIENNVPDVTKATWKSLVMDSDKPVLVEFWAPWCGPCRIILPVIAKLSKTYEDKLTCFKLNTDESPDIATQYGIRSIPTIIIFKSGEKKDAVIGAVPESTLITCIEKFV